MQPIRIFNVSPSIPEKLEPLRKLAYNLYWSWSVEIKDLFRRLDPELWDTTRHNPVLMLGTISQERLQSAIEDDGFIAQMERSAQQLDEYLSRRTWYIRHRATTTECYAYYSAEFGLTDCLPIYSGGLGILAGDHLKSASDLGLPLVGVGLLYQKGYFAQYLNPDGWQQERYPINDFYNMPIHLERNPDGSELRISVDYPADGGGVKPVYARIWRIQVGSVPLYLMDTNIEPNIQSDQDITDYLYGGDIDVRIRQEMMLGIGGTKMLEALGLKPTAYHMNEGHAGFLSLQRLSMLMLNDGLDFAQAAQMAQSTQIFTTHTPVPAGIDLFPPDKVWYYLGTYCDRLKISKDSFLALGRLNPHDYHEPFSMANFAIKMATYINGVSKLHGAVSRQMFNGLWQQLPTDEVPITSITNGVHARTWVQEDTQVLYDRYLGPSWSSADPSEQKIWDRISAIPDEELWRNHERAKARLVVFARERLKKQLSKWGASAAEIQEAGEALDPTALTIGFARRFATYKRGTLFLYDRDRIKKLLCDRTRKLQFIIAGKAHPKDTPGKELIRDIVRFSREHDVRHSIVFIEDYDTYVSGLMLAGCDIWLNTPLRPREASGTSGMKAAMNGCANMSVLDGWWDEADYFKTGWPIGLGEEYDDLAYQNRVESNAIYELLEKDALPLYYTRNEDGVPRGWVAKMKDAIRLNTPLFNTARMVRDYAQQAYIPASDRFMELHTQQYAKAKALSNWKHNLAQKWFNIQIKSVDIAEPATITVNQPITVKAQVYLAGLTSEDVQVELYQGEVAENGHIVKGSTKVMTLITTDEGYSTYHGETSYSGSGLHGLALRILPKHPNLANAYEPRLIKWAK